MTGTHSVTDSGLKVKKRRHLSTCIKLLKSESPVLRTQSANIYALRRIAFFLHFLAHCELRHTTTHKIFTLTSIKLHLKILVMCTQHTSIANIFRANGKIVQKLMCVGVVACLSS